MKKISLFALVLGLVVLATACGPAGGAPTPEARPTSPSRGAPTPEAIPTSSPAPTPAGAEVPASASGPGEVQVIEVTADATGYDPLRIQVKAGSQIRFIITNVDNELHDLYNRRANINMEAPAGQTRTYDWVAPEEKGTYMADCTLHEGLTLTIIVE